MKAEELINNNALSTKDLLYVVNQDGKEQEVVFKEVALTAVKMARCDMRDKAIEAFTKVIREEFEYRG